MCKSRVRKGFGIVFFFFLQQKTERTKFFLHKRKILWFHDKIWCTFKHLQEHTRNSICIHIMYTYVHMSNIHDWFLVFWGFLPYWWLTKYCMVKPFSDCVWAIPVLGVPCTPSATSDPLCLLFLRGTHWMYSYYCKYLKQISKPCVCLGPIILVEIYCHSEQVPSIAQISQNPLGIEMHEHFFDKVHFTC